MSGPRAVSTVAIVTSPESPAASFPTRPSSGRVFDEELRRLLRSRLILVHLLALALGVLIVAVSCFSTMQAANPAQGQGYWWGLALPLAECLIGAVVLWRAPGM